MNSLIRFFTFSFLAVALFIFPVHSQSTNTSAGSSLQYGKLYFHTFQEFGFWGNIKKEFTEVSFNSPDLKIPEMSFEDFKQFLQLPASGGIEEILSIFGEQGWELTNKEKEVLLYNDFGSHFVDIYTFKKPTLQPNKATSSISEIEKLFELKNKGAISETEYQQLKNKIFSK